jgi:uncharacterized membrane protein (UPF0127 family)
MIIYDPNGKPAQSDPGYEHKQVVPERTWLVNHRLGYRPAAISVWVEDTMSLVEIAYVDDDNLVVQFNSAEKGICKVK